MVAAWMFGCGVLSVPSAHVDGVSLTSLTMTQASLEVSVGVHNPLWVDVPVRALRWEMRVDDVTLADGVSAKDRVLLAGQNTVLPVPVDIRYADLWAAAKRTARNDGVPYSVLFELDTVTPTGPSTLPLHHVGVLPPLRAPSVDLVDIDVGIEDDGRLRMDLALHLSLPESFRITDVAWAVAVDGVPLSEGRVRADPSGNLRFPVYFDARATAAATWAYAWGEAQALELSLLGQVSTPLGLVPLSVDHVLPLTDAPVAPEAAR